MAESNRAAAMSPRTVCARNAGMSSAVPYWRGRAERRLMVGLCGAIGAVSPQSSRIRRSRSNGELMRAIVGYAADVHTEFVPELRLTLLRLVSWVT